MTTLEGEVTKIGRHTFDRTNHMLEIDLVPNAEVSQGTLYITLKGELKDAIGNKFQITITPITTEQTEKEKNNASD